MARIHTKCMWFKDSGEPVVPGRGCPSPNCPFTHPSDSTFEKAYRSKLATPDEMDTGPKRFQGRRYSPPPTPDSLRRVKEERIAQERHERERREKLLNKEESRRNSWNDDAYSRNPKANGPDGLQRDAGWASKRRDLDSRDGRRDSGSYKHDRKASADQNASSESSWSAAWDAVHVGTEPTASASGWDAAAWNAADSSGWNTNTSTTEKANEDWGLPPPTTASGKSISTGGWGNPAAETALPTAADDSGWGSATFSAPTPAFAAPSAKPAFQHPPPRPSADRSNPSSRKTSLDLTDAVKKLNVGAAPTVDPRRPPPRLTAEEKGKGRAFERPPILSINTTTANASTQAQPLSAAGSTQSRHRAGSSSISAMPSATPTTPMGPPPLPTRPSKMPPPPVPSGTSSTKLPKDMLTEAKAIKRAHSHTQEMKAKVSIMKAGLSPEERKEVYHKTIGYIVKLVRVEVQLNKAQATEAAWKRNLHCPHYQNSTQRTREKLENGRKDARDHVMNLRNQRTDLLKELIALPDIPTRPHQPYNAKADREKLMTYSLELKTWMEELNIYKRVSHLHKKQKLQDTAKTKSQPEAEPETTAATSRGSDAMSVDGTPSAAPTAIPPTQEKITAQDILEAIEELQVKADAALDLNFETLYTQSPQEAGLEYLKALIQQKGNAVKKGKVLKDIKDRRELTKDIATTVKERQETWKVIRENRDTLKANVEALERHVEEIEESNATLESLIEQAELTQRKRAGEIEELSTLFRAYSATVTAPRRVRDITIDDIAPELHEELVKEIKEELQPVLAGLVSGTAQVGEGIKAAMEKLVEPLITKTAELANRVKGIPPPP
ncbi:hypothetical protein D9611_005590 [Ephemerocybe angulata]|uniref:C3H1-type domain-containing protein n=1 Tax=Ephemerocybe angulata TaxID=980116 RepID=A0A8H5BHP6_9AGAR|nr:hypothetical protein D9611_005590 [Tulosesus angulatus]